ncbi:MAG: polysaccharide deacetylase family protein [Acidimicrobiales bacterium]
MIREMTQQAVKAAASAADRVRGTDEGVVVLIYHRVGRRTSLEVDLPTSLFDEQMAVLGELGRVTSLDDALDWLSSPESVAKSAVKPPIVVTFDDGTDDLADIATPILERYAIPATLYVATEFIEHDIRFPADGRALSWSALADMVTTGLITVGSHTHTHALLDRLDLDTAKREFDISTRLIEDRLGLCPIHFAYPKAVTPSSSIERVVRDRYRSAALAGTRPNRRGHTDVHRLHRSPVQLGDGMRWFERKLAGGLALEDDLRRAANRWRYSATAR